MSSLPKSLRSLPSVFQEGGKVPESYWFSYKNLSGEILHVFWDHVRIESPAGEEKLLEFSHIQGVSIDFLDKSTAQNNSIIFRTEVGSLRFDVDTDTIQGHDLYPIFAAIRRAVIISSNAAR